MIQIKLTERLIDDLPEALVLGPFEEVAYDDAGFFYGDGEKIAEVFEETIDDMMGNPLGHPMVGAVFVPRTFHQSEHEHPEYPGKPYRRLTITQTKED